MNHIENAVFNQLVELIEEDRLVLPTLPEIALRAREVAENPHSSASDIAKVINNDPAMAVRVIKVANSPLMRGPREIKDVQTAISRLGLTCVCNLIIGLAMEQMFQATTDVIDKAMRKSWAHSCEVASIAHGLCANCTPHLKADEAMLAGMIHQIGVLPILTYVEESELVIDSITLQRLSEKIHPRIGSKILQSWRFPAELIDVPKGYQKFDRQTANGKADYVDLIMVANLHALRDSSHPHTRLQWDDIPAITRLGLDTAGHTVEENLAAALAAASGISH